VKKKKPGPRRPVARPLPVTGKGREGPADNDSHATSSGDREAGHQEVGHHEVGYDEAGYDEAGYDRAGYDRAGYDEAGYDRAGYDRAGYNEAGYDRTGYDRTGYDEAGYDRAGYDRTGYNEGGYDRAGYDRGADADHEGDDDGPLSRLFGRRRDSVTASPDLVGDPDRSEDQQRTVEVPDDRTADHDPGITGTGRPEQRRAVPTSDATHEEGSYAGLAAFFPPRDDDVDRVAEADDDTWVQEADDQVAHHDHDNDHDLDQHGGDEDSGSLAVAPGFADSSDAVHDRDGVREEEPGSSNASAVAGPSSGATTYERRPGTRQRRPIPFRDVALLVSLVVVVILTAVLVRSAHEGPGATTADQPVRARVPEPPAAAPTVGSYVETRVTKNGVVHVRQWVRSATPLSAVRLEVPAVRGQALLPTATHVVVVGDQEILNPPDTVGLTGRRLFFDARPRQVYLTYTLQGAVERSPSVPGRALVRAAALQVVYSPLDGPSRVTLVAKKVLSMACQSSPLEAPRPCGAPGKGGWSVLLRGDARSDSVVAQVDLT
jgi:hypothetical protein